MEGSNIDYRPSNLSSYCVRQRRGCLKSQRRDERGRRKPRKKTFQKRELGHIRDPERVEWNL